MLKIFTLTEILYTNRDTLYLVSFQFTNKVRAPQKDTYSRGEKYKRVPPNLRKLIFGLHHTALGFRLTQIKMVSMKQQNYNLNHISNQVSRGWLKFIDKDMVEWVVSGHAPIDEEKVLHIGDNEKIVAAKVDTFGDRPVQVQFMLFFENF